MEFMGLILKVLVLTRPTSLASEKCQQEKRKTVNGEDILFAMTSLGFENYAEALKVYLSKYREVCQFIFYPWSFTSQQKRLY